MHGHDNYVRGVSARLLGDKRWWVPVGSMLPIVVYFGWRYDGIEPGYTDRVIYGALFIVMFSTPIFASLLLFIAKRIETYLRPVVRRTLRLRSHNTTVSDVEELLTLAVFYLHIVLSCSLLIVLFKANESTAEWLTKSVRTPDRGTLLACLFLALLAIYNLAAHKLQTYLARNDCSQGRAEIKDKSATAELAWFFGLMALALMPAALRASVVPNLLFGVIVPVIVFYVRITRGSSESQHGEESGPGGCG
jgi:hypothetical protein